MPKQIPAFLATCVYVLCMAASSQTPQTTQSPSIDAQGLQAQARLALFSTVPVLSVSLDGNFTSVEGSLRQQGSVHVLAKSDGSYLVNLARSQGKVNETRTVSAEGPSCSWTDQSGKANPIPSDNCLVPAWFFPGVSLLANGSTNAEWHAASAATSVDGPHLFIQNTNAIPQTPGTNTQSGKVDLLLDNNTHLPVAASYVMHPDRAVNADIQFKVTYSDYRNVSSVMIPFHIQQWINGSQVLDLQIDNAAIQ